MRVPGTDGRADKRFALLGRYSSEIRTGCANERPSGSVRGAPGNWCPYRDRQQSATQTDKIWQKQYQTLSALHRTGTTRATNCGNHTPTAVGNTAALGLYPGDDQSNLSTEYQVHISFQQCSYAAETRTIL